MDPARVSAAAAAAMAAGGMQPHFAMPGGMDPSRMHQHHPAVSAGPVHQPTLFTPGISNFSPFMSHFVPTPFGFFPQQMQPMISPLSSMQSRFFPVAQGLPQQAPMAMAPPPQMTLVNTNQVPMSEAAQAQPAARRRGRKPGRPPTAASAMDDRNDRYDSYTPPSSAAFPSEPQPSVQLNKSIVLNSHPKKEDPSVQQQFRYAIVERHGRTQQCLTSSTTFAEAKIQFKAYSSQNVEVVRCRCGVNLEEGQMIRCDECETWQHAECMLVENPNASSSYMCELCEPREFDEEILLAVDKYRKGTEGAAAFKIMIHNDRRLVLGSCIYHGSKSRTRPPTICRVVALEQLANGERQVVLEPYLRPEEAAPPPSRRFYPKEVLATGDALVLPVMAITGNSCCVMDITSWRNGRPAEFLYEDIYVCEHHYNRTSQVFTPCHEERWGAVQDTYLFQRFDNPVQTRRRYAKDTSAQVLPEDEACLGPLTLANLTKGHNPDHLSAIAPGTPLAEVWCCTASGCHKKFSNYHQIAKHINDEHFTEPNRIQLLSRVNLPVEVARGLEGVGDDFNVVSETLENHATAAQRNRNQTRSLDSARHPLSVHPTSSGMQSSYAQPEFKPSRLHLDASAKVSSRDGSAQAEEAEEDLGPTDQFLANQPDSSRVTGPGRRKLSGKGLSALVPDHQDLPPRGPLTAEVLDVMPYSLGFVIRVFHKDKVYQGVCVQQETSARAALPRSRFSRVVTGPAFGEHRVGLDRRSLACPEPGCEALFSKPYDYFAHINSHNTWAPIQLKGEQEAGQADAGKKITCPYPNCEEQFLDAYTLCTHILNLHADPLERLDATKKEEGSQSELPAIVKTEDTGDVSSLNGTSAANPTATADSGAVQAMAPPPSQENGHVGPEKREHDESHNSAADDGPLSKRARSVDNPELDEPGRQ